MENKNLTAVEWLEAVIKHCERFGTNIEQKDIEEAKAMEKEQIMLANGAGYRDGIFYANGEQWLYESPEQYYNETYKQD